MSPSRNDAYRRNRPGTRKPRPAVLIVCEGDTEEIYLREFIKLHGLTAQVLVAPNTQGSAPISVVNFALDKYRRDGPFDHVFCIFDRDQHESYERARAKVTELAGRRHKPVPIHAITSIPSFELWLLLHFEQTDAPFLDSKAVIERIRSHYPGYGKASITACREIVARLETAIQNAGWLAARAEDNNQNPSTTMHQLVGLLRELARH